MVHLPDRPSRETATSRATRIAGSSSARPRSGSRPQVRAACSLRVRLRRRKVVQFVLSASVSPTRKACRPAQTRDGRPAGRIAKRSRIHPRACSSRRCRNSRSYWATEHDWRKIESKLNALPQFVTEIDGLDIHFIHVRSKHDNALPMIVTHGWPGSIIEQMKIIDPLTNPTAHGASASDAFHLVIPSLPGHGFSGKPTAPGWTPVSIARAWATLMQRLGYVRYVAQGGDWGNAVSEVMALQQPTGLLGIHTNMAATVPADVSKALSVGGPAPAGLSGDEKHAWDQLDDFYKHGLAYAQEMSNRPQTLYGIVDSPVGLAAWMLDHDIRSYGMISRVFDGKTEGLTRDDVLDNVTLYWLTNTAISSARLYWDTAQISTGGGFFDVRGVTIPGRRERLPRRDLCGAAKLGGAGVSQTHLLQQAREGRPLRGVGAAQAVQRGNARGFPSGAPVDLRSISPPLTGVRSTFQRRGAQHEPSRTNVCHRTNKC